MIFSVVKRNGCAKYNRDILVASFLKRANSSLLNALHASKNAYNFTGSRYFLTHEPGSDYDLFALKCYEVIAELESLGFKPLDPTHNFYNDLNTAQVYRLGNIDVQLVKDDKLKLEVQTNNYTLLSRITPLDKVTKRMIWNLLFEATGTRKNTFGGYGYPFFLADREGWISLINNDGDIVNILLKENYDFRQEIPKVPWPTAENMGFVTQLWIGKAINGFRGVCIGSSFGVKVTTITQDDYGVFPPDETRVARRTHDDKIELY